MRQRSPDWRMRSPSEEGRDNATLLERGPLGSGETGSAKGPHTEAGRPAGGRASRRLQQTHGVLQGGRGSDLKRMVKKITRPHTWSISAVPQAVPDTDRGPHPPPPC